MTHCSYRRHCNTPFLSMECSSYRSCMAVLVGVAPMCHVQLQESLRCAGPAASSPAVPCCAVLRRVVLQARRW